MSLPCRYANAGLLAARLPGEVHDLVSPKLISGELRVRDAERIVAEAAAG
jgi:hypothetical protein